MLRTDSLKRSPLIRARPLEQQEAAPALDLFVICKGHSSAGIIYLWVFLVFASVLLCSIDRLLELFLNPFERETQA